MNDATDSQWNINNLIGTFQGYDTPIVPTTVIVDNINNAGLVNFSFGPFSFQVSPYTRKTFPIPANTQSAEFTISAGIVDVFICSYDPGIPDDTNQLATSSGSSKVTYPYVAIIANAAQQASDYNSQIIFSAATPITYTLLDSTTLSNGQIIFSLRNRGSSTVIINPIAGQTINGIFTNAIPLILYPGDCITNFGPDGSGNFNCGGRIHYQSSQQTFVTSTAMTANTGWPVKPSQMEPIAINLVAEFGYTPGMEASSIASSQGTSEDVSMYVNPAYPANIYYPIGSNGLCVINAGGGTKTNITAANWGIVLRAWLDIG